jgi:hypothetical protein
LLAVWMRPGSWLSLALCFAIGAVAYVAALLALALSREERADLLALLGAAGRGVSVASRRATEAMGVQGSLP